MSAGLIQEEHKRSRAAAIGFRELGRVVELLELDDLAAADGEDVHPVARHRATGLANRPGIVPEHADAILGGEELPRREIRCILVLCDSLKELLHSVLPFQLPSSG